MEVEWDGKSRGSVLGFKIFVFFIKNFGINAAYMLMHLPVPYFCLFSGKNVRGLYYYFRKRHNFSYLKTCYSIYKCYFEFGKTLIDKVAISAGLRQNYSFQFDGHDNITKVLDANKGGLLISAHVGNFELAQHFFKEQIPDSPISIVITDQDHQAIKDYLEPYLQRKSANLIVVKDDMSHIFEINAALEKNRIVCIAGDRFMPGGKFFKSQLLGKDAKFPSGPFILAEKLKIPVLFVYVMREPKKHYHLYAEKVEANSESAEELLDIFTMHLQKMVMKYPYQWFNFYDFWEDRK